MSEETKKTLINFFSKQPLKKFKKGDSILHAGDKPNYIGFIKSGFVRVYVVNESGQEISMSFFKPMLYFTSIFAMTGSANKFNFEAVSPVEMWESPIDEFLSFCKKFPTVGQEIMNSVCNLFLDMVENTGKLLAGDSLGKVALIITSVTDSKAKFALTHKMIASLTGLTRETVTLQMLKLEKMKLVDNKNRKVTILDRKGLDKIIAG